MVDSNTLTETRSRCVIEAQRLMKKYFGNIAHEASVERPETIGEYTRDLPRRVTAEYEVFLEKILHEVEPDGTRHISELLNHEKISHAMTDESRRAVNAAYADARHVTLWERITCSNHEDVAYYKGLLKEYTQEMLNCMMADFLDSLANEDKISHRYNR